ncbi:MAG: GGDEF domain-containing protein [Gammaproteobacteria bacterium]
MDSSTDWKQLYQTCKVEQIRLCKQHVVLQKGILRLALTYIGRNHKLDKLLRHITNTVRNSEKDTIVDDKLLLEVISWVTRLNALDKGKLEKYRLEKDNSQFESFDSTNEMVSSDFPVLEIPVEVEVLFGKARETQTEAEFDQLIGEASSLISKYCNFASRQIASSNASSNYQLLQLLEKVSFEKEQLAKINHTKSVLAGKIVQEQKKEPYELVADLINESTARNSNLEGIGDFLKGTTQRLEKLHGYLDKSDLINTDKFKDSLTFGQNLDQQFDELREGMDKVDSIKSLKYNIESHLDFLNQNVAEYVENEKERMDDAEKTLGLLNSQLGELQLETQILRKSVEKEQAKSLTDALTSIGNRRAYEEKLDKEIDRWRRQGGNLSLMVLDLDKFKLINDSYGHVVGDKVLRGLTGTFKRGIRRTDFLARYGGEEFVMIMPATTLEETVQIADKLRHDVEECVFRYQGNEVPVTISIGVAEFHQGDTAETVFARADEALYLAKNTGRNICRSEIDISETAVS